MGYDSKFLDVKMRAIIHKMQVGTIFSRKNSEAAFLESEYMFRMIAEQNVLGIMIIQDDIVKYANQAAGNIFDYDKAEMLKWEKGAYIQMFDDCFQELAHHQINVSEHDSTDRLVRYLYKVNTKEQEEKWVEFFIENIQYEGLKASLITMVDVTLQKSKDDELVYLSNHDLGTGLFNRTYFENQLELLDSSCDLPISIIIGDVNGLKLTNDVFGHQKGDELLKSIANILTKAVHNKGIVTRWGGDEFAILLPKAPSIFADIIVNRIKDLCSLTTDAPIKPSIAIGCATMERCDQDIQLVLKEAEDRMYRHKLVESKSVRSGIIASLEKMLLERDFETEEHAKRLQLISAQIGEKMELSDNDMDALSLLSILHDIGKIAIPDHILLKPDKLTPEEWKEMKKHAEIGYRIASSSQELSHVAEYILSHHERWDGQGYPRGLKMEEIPKIARILTIVDAYDAMTSTRPYKKPISHAAAIEEIKRCAGTHFDPSIVAVFVDLWVG
ncbi:MAG: diguanylate cyclase [Hyphomonadaceae bacterium]|nr:diguanylate cyclase [Clostridia bacterium]